MIYLNNYYIFCDLNRHFVLMHSFCQIDMHVKDEDILYYVIITSSVLRVFLEETFHRLFYLTLWFTFTFWLCRIARWPVEFAAGRASITAGQRIVIEYSRPQLAKLSAVSCCIVPIRTSFSFMQRKGNRRRESFF